MLNAKTRETADVHKILNVVARVAANIKVGFPSGKQHIANGDNGSQLNDDELAKILSYGSARIPARPFLEEGILSRKKELYKMLEEQAEAVVDGKEANWDKVGVAAVGAVQEFVRGGFYKENVPNAPATIAAKSKPGQISDMPLIDTAELINSVTYIVEKGSNKK